MGNVEMIRGLYDAFGRGDVPAVLAGMDADTEWHEAEGNPYAEAKGFKGPDAIVEKVFMPVGTEWDAYTVTPKEFADAGETVVVEGRYTGSYKESGKPFDAQFCHVWRVSGGKVKGFQQYTDTAQMQETMKSS